MWLDHDNRKNTTKFIDPFENLIIESQQRQSTPKPVVEAECEQRRVVGQEIIMEKVQNKETYFSKFIENILVHILSDQSKSKEV